LQLNGVVKYNFNESDHCQTKMHSPKLTQDPWNNLILFLFI